MKKLLTILAIGILGLALALIIQALRLNSRQRTDVDPVTVAVDEGSAVARFAAALTFPTISNQDPSQTDSAAFRDLHAHLEASYSRLHETLNRETVSELSLLYTWVGTDPSLEPVVLMGHIDVVPVIEETRDRWTHPPFSGVVEDGFIWGRGAMDDKATVVSILEAVEMLTAEGYRPARTFYLAFGHDEEIGGGRGAARIAATLVERGVDRFFFVLDEGGVIADGAGLGLDGAVAVIGIAEKGSVSLELVAEEPGGHSSVPPPESNIGILARAIDRLQSDPFPARIDGATRSMLEFIGPEMGFTARLAMANMWLLEPLVIRRLTGDPQTAAMVRTTTAPTIIRAGVKSNVLPSTATAIVNFRILPGETPETVAERVRRVIDDPRVDVRLTGGRPPSPVSSPDTEAFRLIERTIRETSPEPLIVAPYLVVGGTDARYYSERSHAVYRFLPVKIGADDMQRVHGIDERLSPEGLVRSVRFFYRLIRNADTP